MHLGKQIGGLGPRSLRRVRPAPAPLRRPATALAAVLALLAVAAAPATARPQRALAVGDSLAEGTAPYLRGLLVGWRVRDLHRVGLHTAQGLAILRRQRRPLPPYLVVSLGTNDDPRSTAAFRRAVRHVLAATAPRGCVVWPTIVRPPLAGRSYAALNRVLAREAARSPRLRLVDWVGLVRRHRGWLARDGVHARAAGYRARARAIVAALRSCPG
jgi:lysophospholipase L1-like esterase